MVGIVLFVSIAVMVVRQEYHVDLYAVNVVYIMIDTKGGFYENSQAV